MAMKPCRECKKDVSSGAAKCPHCGISRPGRRIPLVAWIIGAILVLGWLASLGNDGGQSAAVASVAGPVDTAAVRVADSVKAAARAEAVKALAELKKQFIFTKDEIKPEEGWYEHRQQTTKNSYNRIYLDGPVHSSGHTYLRSHYYGDSWIFHTKVEARVGTRVIETAEIPSYDDANETENGSGSVWETISFTNERDNGLYQAIATAAPGDTITIRYLGKYGKTFQLSARDRAAIRDSYRLGALLKATQ